MRTVAAFANTGGGVLLFGVRNDGIIMGIGVIGATTLERVTCAITDNTDPTLYPTVEAIRVGSRTVIVVSVAESANKPHLAYGRGYKRVGAATVTMSRDEYERLLLQRQQFAFDRQVVPGATYNDLDEEKVRWFLHRRGEKHPETTLPVAPLPRLLVDVLEAARERDGELVPTYTGLFFFGQNPQRFLPCSELKLARFQGTTMIDFIDEMRAQGTLPEMLDEAERFIRRNTRKAMTVVGFEGVTVTEYPYRAIREALVNAMAHRDYLHTSAIQMMIFDDRLEVQSPGGALVSLSEIEGIHVTRNDILCRRFHDIGEMEEYGTGITKMKRLVREHGLAEPVFEERAGFFRVTFHGPGDRILDLAPREGVIDLREMGLNRRQIEALRLMVNQGRLLTRGEHAGTFEVSDRTAARDLARLVKTGLAKRTGRGPDTRYVAA